nr:MAG: pIII protein [unidentified adenovirus]
MSGKDAPPPSYDSLYAPFRYLSAAEGRNSIVYSPLPPVYDTTQIYLIDNKSADITDLNRYNDHSNFQTTVIHNADYTPRECLTQSIKLDDRSRWGGELKTLLSTNIPNICSYLNSNTFKVKLPVSKNLATNKKEYEWVTLSIPEGNYSQIMTIDLMNEAILYHYLRHGAMNNIKEDEMGVKFDTRNFHMGKDPILGLVIAGNYMYEAFHPDIILAPGCAVDFTESRLNNLLGIRKRYPYQSGFIISYDDLIGGNIPALLDVQHFKTQSAIRPLSEDTKKRSYHVGEDPEALATDTYYRSWYLAYNYNSKNKSTIKEMTLLTVPDVTCGTDQIYWSLPDLAENPVGFKSTTDLKNLPVVGMDLLPLRARSFYNAQAVYSQLLQDSTSKTHLFDRFPDNQILIRPPAPTIDSICENVPTLTHHGTIPLKNNISGVQRVTVTDARRRACPYIYKSIGIISPKVLSSRTIQ